MWTNYCAELETRLTQRFEVQLKDQMPDNVSMAFQDELNTMKKRLNDMCDNSLHKLQVKAWLDNIERMCERSEREATNLADKLAELKWEKFSTPPSTPETNKEVEGNLKN